MKCGVIAATLLLVSLTALGAPPVPGGWIGWAFLGDAGDLPLRIWIDGEGGASFDGVVWQSDGWPAKLTFPADDRMVLETATSKGTAIALDGSLEDGVRYHGTIRFGEHEGSFELLHAPELAPVPASAYADLRGFVDMDDGDVLQLWPRSWGELMVRSVTTGERRTLLPSGEDRFTTGPATYVPIPVEARWVVERENGAPHSLVREASGTRTRGTIFRLLEETASFDNGDVHVVGTFYRRPDDVARAGLVLLGGSGWETRDAHEVRARWLAALGFAVLVFDKRGFGESGGQDPSSFATIAADAVAGARHLRSRADIREVGYAGISRGGWTAPLAVAQDADASFLILFVPPATSPAEQEHGARLARLRADGYAEEDVALVDRLLDAAWEFVAEDTDDRWTRYEALLHEAQGREIPEDVLPPIERDPEAWRWSRLNMLHDPRPALAKVEVPVLAIFGEEDRQVLSAVHRPRLADALAHDADVTLVTIPGVGHDLARGNPAPVHRGTGNGGEGMGVVAKWWRARDPVR